MSSHFDISPKDLASMRFISLVRRSLQKAYAKANKKDRLTRAEMARRLGVDRAVITRMLNGQTPLTTRSVAELAFAMDLEPTFGLHPAADARKKAGDNGAFRVETVTGVDRPAGPIEIYLSTSPQTFTAERPEWLVPSTRPSDAVPLPADDVGEDTAFAAKVY